MKQISTISLVTLNNDEHHQFHFVIYEQTAQHDDLIRNDEALLTRYWNDYSLEETTMAKTRGSDKTLAVVEAKQNRKEIYSSFRLKVKSAMLDIDPQVSAAAKRIFFVMNKYGNLNQLPQGEQTSAIGVICKEMTDTYKDDLKLIGCDVILNNLLNANSVFNMAYNTRGIEKVNAVNTKVVNARQVLDNDYRELVLQINSLAVTTEVPDYEVLIDNINYQIQYFKQLVANRRARLAAEKKKPVPVPPVPPKTV